MIRIYKKQNNITINEENEINILRCDGGSWYSEQFQDGQRKSYKVIQRITLSDSTSIIEVLEPLEDDFIQLPCWQDEFPIHVQKLQDSVWIQNRCWLVVSVPLLAKGGQGAQIPQEVQLPQEVQQELEPLYNEIKEKIMKYMSSLQQVSSNPTYHLQHRKQDPKQQVKSPLQKQQHQKSSSQNRREEKSFSNQEQVSSLPPQTLLQAPFSAVPKGVQAGLLCPPVFLPDEQSPRKSPSHPKGPKRLPLQARSKLSNQCLIDLSES